MTPSEVRAGFQRRGETIREWAEVHSFPPPLVYAVLAGRVLGIRGQAHGVAVALGLKPDVTDVEPKSQGGKP